MRIPQKRVNEIGKNFMMLRKRYGLFQKDIKGLTQQEVSHIEVGLSLPTVYALECYMKVFGLEAVEEAMQWKVIR